MADTAEPPIPTGIAHLDFDTPKITLDCKNPHHRVCPMAVGPASIFVIVHGCIEFPCCEHCLLELQLCFNHIHRHEYSRVQCHICHEPFWSIEEYMTTRRLEL